MSMMREPWESEGELLGRTALIVSGVASRFEPLMMLQQGSSPACGRSDNVMNRRVVSYRRAGESSARNAYDMTTLTVQKIGPATKRPARQTQMEPELQLTGGLPPIFSDRSSPLSSRGRHFTAHACRTCVSARLLHLHCMAAHKLTSPPTATIAALTVLSISNFFSSASTSLFPFSPSNSPFAALLCSSISRPFARGTMTS